MTVAAATRARAWRGTQSSLLSVYMAHKDTTGATQTFAWSTVGIADATAAGGWKDPRLTTVGHYLLGLSSRGRLEGTTFSFELADTDNLFRAWLENPLQVGVLDLETFVDWTTVEDRALGYTPVKLFRGVTNQPQGAAGFRFAFSCRDWLSARTNQPLPLPRLGDDFPLMPVDTTDRLGARWYGQLVGALGAGAVPAVPVGPWGAPGLSIEPDDTLPTVDVTGVNSEGGGSLTTPIAFAICGVKAGKEGPPAFTGVGSDGSPTSERVNWNHNATFDSYRIYGSDQGFNPRAPGGVSTFVRLLTHDGTTLDGGLTGDMSVLLTSDADGSDYLAQGGSTYAFEIAAHAVKSVDRICQAGIPIDSAKLGVTWFVPGYTGYSTYLANTYYDAPRGQRYTLIFVTGQDAIDAISGSRPITLDISGVETVGNSSGTLIVDGFLQFKHLLRNDVLANTPYVGGLWATTDPAWADTTSRILASSFTTAAADYATVFDVTADRAWGVAVSTPILQVLAERCLDLHVEYASTKAGQFRIVLRGVEADPTGAVVETFTEALDITDGSFSFQDQTDSSVFFNRSAYSHTASFSADGSPSYVTASPVDHAVNRDLYARGRVIVNPEPYVFSGVRDAATAEALATRMLELDSRPMRLVPFRVPVYGLTLEPGDIIKVTHREGPGSTGFVNRRLLVRSLSPALDLGAIDLVCQDLYEFNQDLAWLLETAGRSELSQTTYLGY